MQFASRITGAKNFSELQKIIAQARACNELRDNVLNVAIGKLDSKECKNVRLGHELCRLIPIDTLPLLDAFTLRSIMSCASQAFDFRLAHKVFLLVNNPNSYTFYYYINSFKKAKANELTPEMIEELGSLWKKVELSMNIEHDKLLNQLFSVLSFSKEKQHSLIVYLLSKPANISFSCGLLGNFLKYCLKNGDLDLATKVWDWGHSIREKERGTFSFFQVSYQYYTLFPPSIGELRNLWSHVRNSGLDCRVELVTSMCKSLSGNVLEQSMFIKGVVSKKPDESFDCGLLGAFLKHCSETKDLQLARDVWFWGQCIRDREFNTYWFFLISYQYYDLFPPSTSELQSLWSQVMRAKLNDRVELVTFMCSALSADRKEQRSFILSILSQEPKSSFNNGLLGAFLKHCSETKDLKLAHDIWLWGQSIRDRECKAFWYFLITYQYYDLFPPSISELRSLWSQVVSANLDDRIELVTSMYSALSADRKEQRNFICGLISKEPYKSFDCGLLGGFLKHCSETKDLKLARDIWLWGQCIIHRSLRDSSYVLVSFQYLTLFETVTKQREFIVNVISNTSPSNNHCGLIGTFLTHCSDQNNLELARRVWSWGLDIRRRWKGTSKLCQVTIQYLCICKGSGDLKLLEEVWKEAKVYGVINFKEAIGAFINALAANGAVDRVLELFGEVPSDIVNEYILTSTLNSLSHAGRDVDALRILRRIQNENPIIISVISYTSVIDAFARNGNFEIALSLVEEMKQYGIKPDAITWKTILSPCRFYKNLAVALKAFEELQRVEHEPDDMTSAYVLLADVYKSCGDFLTASQLHDERISRGLFKNRGGVQLSLPDSETISFHVNETPSSLDQEVCEQIFETLDDWKTILEQMGESVNGRHSEMLALAYAIRVLKLKSVHVRKNLRVFDCHAATAAIYPLLKCQ